MPHLQWIRLLGTHHGLEGVKQERKGLVQDPTEDDHGGNHEQRSLLETTEVNQLQTKLDEPELTIVEPTATLILKVSWSLTETLTATMHSAIYSDIVARLPSLITVTYLRSH